MKTGTLTALIALAMSSWTMAAVSLFSDLSEISAEPGAEFSVTLNLLITGADELEAVSYYWQADTVGIFELIDRELLDSPLSWTFHDDAAVVESPGNLLDPTNALNLGGLTDFETLDAGTWLVARYTFRVAETAQPGSYVLTTYSLPGTGWATPPPNSQDFPFDQQAALTVTIVPEPSVWALLMAALMAAGNAARRAHRANNASIRPV